MKRMEVTIGGLARQAYARSRRGTPASKARGRSRPCWRNLLLRLSLHKSEVLRLLSHVVVQVTKKLAEHARPHDDPAARWTPSASRVSSMAMHLCNCTPVGATGIVVRRLLGSGKLKHGCALSEAQARQQYDFPAREFQRVVMLMWIIKIEASKARDVLVQFLLEKEAIALDISSEFSSVPGRRQTATLGSSEPENARVNEFSNCVRLSGWPTLAPRVPAGRHAIETVIAFEAPTSCFALRGRVLKATNPNWLARLINEL